MYLAKIALDITAKHSTDRIGWLDENKYIKTLWKHKPLSDFWQISTGTINRLAKYGIEDMEGIAKCDENLLYNEFGINAELLIDHAWGREPCLMSDIKEYKSKSKSLSSSQILPCNYNFDDAKLVMREMIQNGCYDMSRQHYSTNLIHLIIGYGDDKSFAKGTTRMSITTNLYAIIGEYADKLFDKIVDKAKPIRRIGYDFADLVPESMEQYDLFTDIEKVKKEKKLIDSVLSIQDRFGKNAILKGIDLNEKATQIDRNKSIGGHKSGEN